jgi:hypothetical protein
MHGYPRITNLVPGLLAGAALMGGCRLNESAPAEPRPELAVAAITNKTYTDPSGQVEVVVKTCDPTALAATNCAYCTVDDGWSRIGGGANILGEASGGAMLQASFPAVSMFTQANANGCTGPAGNPARRVGIDDQATWVTRASGANHQLQAYVIQMRMKGSNGAWFRPFTTEARDNVTGTVNPPATAQVEISEASHAGNGTFLITGGAYLFKNNGLTDYAVKTDAYLVGSYPIDKADGRTWRAVARSQSNPAPPEGMKVYAIFLEQCPEETFKCLDYPELRAVTAAAVSGYGTAALTVPEWQVPGGIGGYSPTSSGGARYLADLIPFNGSSQGFTVRSKAFATGTGQTIGYGLFTGVPFDIYTGVFNHSNKCLGVLNARLDATAPLAQQTCAFGSEPANLRFAMVPRPGGYVALKFQHSGMCADVSGASTADGAAVIQYPCTFADNQLAQLLSYGAGQHYFKFKHSGKCLDVSGAATADGTRFIQYTCANQANQTFHFDD